MISTAAPVRSAFAAWAFAHLAMLRAEYEAELDAGEFIDWSVWLTARWARECATKVAA